MLHFDNRRPTDIFIVIYIIKYHFSLFLLLWVSSELMKCENAHRDTGG